MVVESTPGRASVRKISEIIVEDAKEDSISAMTNKRRTIVINRPIIPHLHFVNLRPEEAMIDRVLFKENKTP